MGCLYQLGPAQLAVAVAIEPLKEGGIGAGHVRTGGGEDRHDGDEAGTVVERLELGQGTLAVVVRIEIREVHDDVASGRARK